MPANRPPNRRKQEIEQERQAKRAWRKRVLINSLKLGIYALIVILAYPYVVNSGLFKSEVKKAAPAAVKKDEYKEPDIEYNFYSLLPNEKIIEPPQEFFHTRENDLSQVKSYLVQVGSFKTKTRAEKLKNLLQKYGFKKVLSDKARAGETTWHRVSLGPLTSLAKAKKTRAHLSLKGIHNSVIKTHRRKNEKN